MLNFKCNNARFLLPSACLLIFCYAPKFYIPGNVPVNSLAYTLIQSKHNTMYKHMHCRIMRSLKLTWINAFNRCPHCNNLPTLFYKTKTKADNLSTYKDWIWVVTQCYVPIHWLQTCSCYLTIKHTVLVDPIQNQCFLGSKFT